MTMTMAMMTLQKMWKHRKTKLFRAAKWANRGLDFLVFAIPSKGEPTICASSDSKCTRSRKIRIPNTRARTHKHTSIYSFACSFVGSQFVKRYGGNLIERISTHNNCAEILFSCVQRGKRMHAHIHPQKLIETNEPRPLNERHGREPKWKMYLFCVTGGTWIGAPISIINTFCVAAHECLCINLFCMRFTSTNHSAILRHLRVCLCVCAYFIFVKIIIDSSQISQQLCMHSHIIYLAICCDFLFLLYLYSVRDLSTSLALVFMFDRPPAI